MLDGALFTDKTRAPVSFKRMLDGALFTDARARRAPLGARARPWDENLTMGSHPTEGRARRGLPVARPWGVGRGEQIPLREHRCAAPRVLTVPKTNVTPANSRTYSTV